MESRAEIEKIKIRNRHLCTTGPRARLQPLVDIPTGVVIPHCPATIGQIHRLTAADADRILQALMSQSTLSALG